MLVQLGRSFPAVLRESILPKIVTLSAAKSLFCEACPDFGADSSLLRNDKTDGLFMPSCISVLVCLFVG